MKSLENARFPWIAWNFKSHSPVHALDRSHRKNFGDSEL
jgi:hypothetical protein